MSTMFNMQNFLDGADREDNDWRGRFATTEEMAEIERKAKESKNVAFETMIEAFRKLDFLQVVRAVNAGVENVARFERRYVWSDVFESLGQDVTQLLHALIVLNVSDESKFHNLLSALPNDADFHFRVSRVYDYSGQKNEGLADQNSAHTFDLMLSIRPAIMSDQVSARKSFDSYFAAIRSTIQNFVLTQARRVGCGSV
jgi:hypothetical protein